LLDSLLQEILNQLVRMTTSSPPSSQISITSVLYQLDQLLPHLIVAGPYSESTLANLVTFCKEVKVVGPELDKGHKEKMDTMQACLGNICKDTQLDLELRLQVLEIIELRTLGWVRSETVDEYYQERYAQFEEKRRKEQERRENKAAKSKGEKKRKLSQTTQSMSSIQEDKKSAIMDSVVGSGSNATRSRRQLVDQLSSQSSIPDTTAPVNKYSRTELLTLATSPLCREAPLHWDKLVPKLPSVVILQHSPSSRGLVSSSGDIERKVPGTMEKVTSVPGSLAVQRSAGN